MRVRVLKKECREKKIVKGKEKGERMIMAGRISSAVLQTKMQIIIVAIATTLQYELQERRAREKINRKSQRK